MAVTFSQIRKVRLTINDPENVIDIKSGSGANPQVAYRASEDTYNVSGTRVDLKVSDTLIEDWINEKNEEYAVYKAYKVIVSRLGRETEIYRESLGVESTEYTRLLDKYKYYASLLDKAKDDYEDTQLNTTGRYKETKSPTIAGGDL